MVRHRLLFDPGTTHVIVTCWHCKDRPITFYPHDLPADITELEFCRRAKCRVCGCDQPYLDRQPKDTRTSWGRYGA